VDHPTAETAETTRLDGRALRARRTRSCIVAAHVELLASGNLRPRAEQITERAGVSVRSLWTHFPDLEALFRATAAEVLARQDADFRPVDPGLSVAERVEGFTRQRAEMLERIGPLARASALREPFSPSLRDYHRRHVERVLDEICALFAAELAGRRGPEHANLLHALTAASTWGSWSTLRDDLGLGTEAARAVMAMSVLTLLGSLSAQPGPRPAAPEGAADPTDLEEPER
jgi:TetR/AcrR family transcriptional regulator of autoinduction and epiphytic fitness